MARTIAPEQVASAYPEIPIASSVKEAAEILGCHTQLVYSLIERGELGSVRTGRLIRVPRHALIAFLEGGQE